MSNGRTLTIFTINGWNGDMMMGPQADCGRYLSDNPVDHGLGLAHWQPIGYDSTGIPLSNGVARGRAEFRNQRQQHPGPCMVSAWSEGSIIFAEELKSDPQLQNDLRAGTLYGYPYRVAGQWNPSGAALGAVPDPGGAGVGGPQNNIRMPDSVHIYCHGPNQPSYDGIHGVDQYTCCSTGLDGDVARIFYNFIFAQYTGAFSEIVQVAEEVAANFGMGMFAAIKTAISWIEFFAGQTAPHQNYTSYAGKTYLANVARSLP
jgi:hypothetical protein